MNVEIKAEFSDDTLSVDLNGDDMGVLIGKRGQTLIPCSILQVLWLTKESFLYPCEAGYGELQKQKKRDIGEPGTKHCI